MSLRAALTRLTSALLTLIAWTASAGACLVKDPSGTLERISLGLNREDSQGFVDERV